MRTVIMIMLASLSLLAVSLQRTYKRVPTSELKKRARAGDEIASLLHRAAAYGHSLRAVLWFLIVITNTALFVTLSLYTPAWLALTVSAALLWFGFIWLPARELTRFSVWLAAKSAPFFGWVLHYLHSPLDRLITFIKRLRPLTVHTGLYDRDDLLNLFNRQHVQVDNRIEQAELEMAARVITFSDVLVREIMTPRRIVKMVSVDEEIGPLLMSELHDSGLSRFPVYEGKQDKIVGTLFLRDVMGAKEGGTARQVMRPVVSYVHEEQTLADALQAILKTHHHLYVVVNSFEDYVGIITIEDVFEQIVGQPVIDEFDQYEDMRAVADRVAKVEHKKRQIVEQPTETAKVAPEQDIDDTI